MAKLFAPFKRLFPKGKCLICGEPCEGLIHPECEAGQWGVFTD